MKLKEFEAKKLLQEVDILTSHGFLITGSEQIPHFKEPYLIKLQTLSGGRGKAGGIIEINNDEEARKEVKHFLHQTFLNEEITEILLDKKVEIKKEFYLGIMFDTSKKCPLLIYSENGGVDIEQLKLTNPEKIIVKDIDYLEGITLQTLETIPLYLHSTIQKLYHSFVQFECKMIEINPLVLTPNQELIAVDAVAVLDDDRKHRVASRKGLDLNFPPRTSNRKATSREIEARKIDQDDHRGVSGKTFLDLDGDIAILTSGGGASMTLMDSLISLNGKPANFTEYSGNPPLEKVEKLTRIVLDKENLSGLLIAGVIANFTDIAETMQGIVNVLKEVKPNFPIVIRRAGPNDDKARQILMQAKEDHNLDLYFFDQQTPLTKAVEIMMELSNKYKQDKGNKQDVNID